MPRKTLLGEEAKEEWLYKEVQLLGEERDKKEEDKWYLCRILDSQVSLTCLIHLMDTVMHSGEIR